MKKAMTHMLHNQAASLNNNNGNNNGVNVGMDMIESDKEEIEDMHGDMMKQYELLKQSSNPPNAENVSLNLPNDDDQNGDKAAEWKKKHGSKLFRIKSSYK